MRSKRSEILGHVDHAGGGLIRGWAADLRATQSRLALDVFRHGVYLGCARAGALRQDLRDQGIGDGRYGFVFHSPSLSETDATDGLAVFAPDAARTCLTIRASTDPSAGSPSGNRYSIGGVRSFFGPLLDAIALDDTSSEQSCVLGPDTDARIGRVFAPSPVPSVSAFAAHVAAKYAVRLPDERFWPWYLETYGLERATRTPLSSSDIPNLSRVYRADRDRDIPRSSWLFGREKGLYAWCVHESRRLRVEDCLVDPDAVRALRTVPWFARSSDYPLSHFMRLQRRRHPLLGERSIRTASDRMAFYAVLMLLALREAHYLAFMPALWLHRMLEERSGVVPFHHAQKDLFGRDAPLISRHGFRTRVESMGFDVVTQRFSTFVGPGHRLAIAESPVDDAIVDVQLVGPLRQSLGLSESCRRIAGALRATGVGLNLVDYRVGMSPQNSSADFDTGSARKARVNVLHLNAEEIPEAMVSLPGLLGEAHAIVIPYWELDRPSCVHRLGLDLVDEVWCTSHFLANVFTGGRPIRHIGMSFDDRFVPKSPSACPPTADVRPDEFTVLCVADGLSWLQRKNVLGAVDAFQAAFEGDTTARLVVKTRNADTASSTPRTDMWRTIVARCSDDPRIRILDAHLDPDEHKTLLAGADCLLSLHRAEGLGLDMLDAMHLGTPVVATGYSGNMDFCTTETAWLVDYSLVPIAPGQYAFVEEGQVWAEPRLDSAVVALRSVRGDAAGRARKIEAAKAHVAARASPASLTARLSRLLRERLTRG